MKIIKNYGIHFFNCLFLIFYDLLFFKLDDLNNLDSKCGLFFVIASLIFVIGVWAEIIIFMIHAVKDKDNNNKAFDLIFIYLFNVYYIPCYYLKRVVKEQNVKVKNIIYLTVTIILTIVMLIGIIYYTIKSI